MYYICIHITFSVMGCFFQSACVFPRAVAVESPARLPLARMDCVQSRRRLCSFDEKEKKKCRMVPRIARGGPTYCPF